MYAFNKYLTLYSFILSFIGPTANNEQFKLIKRTGSYSQLKMSMENVHFNNLMMANKDYNIDEVYIYVSA